MVVIEINALFCGRSLRYEHKKFPVESLTQYTEKKIRCSLNSLYQQSQQNSQLASPLK